MVATFAGGDPANFADDVANNLAGWSVPAAGFGAGFGAGVGAGFGAAGSGTPAGGAIFLAAKTSAVASQGGCLPGSLLLLLLLQAWLADFSGGAGAARSETTSSTWCPGTPFVACCPLVAEEAWQQPMARQQSERSALN